MSALEINQMIADTKAALAVREERLAQGQIWGGAKVRLCNEIRLFKAWIVEMSAAL